MLRAKKINLIAGWLVSSGYEEGFWSTLCGVLSVELYVELAQVVFGQSIYYGADLDAPTQTNYQQPHPIHTYHQVSKWISQDSA